MLNKDEIEEMINIKLIDCKMRTGKEKARLHYLKHKEYYKNYRDDNKENYKKYLDDNKEHMKDLFKSNYEKNRDKKKENTLKKYYFKKAWSELLQIEV